MSTAPVSAADRSLADLLAIESGGVAPLRTSASGASVFQQLHAEGAIEPDPQSGRFKLTAGGRARAVAARDRARAGSMGASPLRAVR